MSMWSSLSRWGGAQYQEDWLSVEQWRACLPANPDLLWSVLVRVDTGRVAWTYRRGEGFRPSP
jgi:hypothetical protein